MGVKVVGELQPGDPQTIGPCRLVRRLGEGGMGRVFLGVSPGGRSVAVKAIRAELAAGPEFRVRFRREVAAARRVSGVFTAMVVDADVDGPVAWLSVRHEKSGHRCGGPASAAPGRAANSPVRPVTSGRETPRLVRASG